MDLRRHANLVLLGALTLSLAVALPAAAQDAAAAKALFEKGVTDLNGGDLEAACPEIAESYRLDPRPGALFTLAECFAKAGKTASAVVRYEDYLGKLEKMSPEDRAKQGTREATAREQRDKLKPRVPWLTLRLATSAPSGTVVSRDGLAQAGAALGVALPVDPGAHTISLRAPGASAEEQTITIAEGEHKDLTLTTQASAEPTPKDGQAAMAPQAKEASAPPAPKTPVEAADHSGHGRLVAGLVVGGAGVAGLLVGAIAGGVTLAKKSSFESSCDAKTKTCRDAAGLAAVDSAHQTGLVSTVGFVAGGAALATGIVLLVTLPKSSSKASSARTPHFTGSFGPGGGSFGVTGAF